MATLSSVKSGIDITLSGTQGTDWEFEPWYHDTQLSTRGIIYIKQATDISFSHNDLNSAPTAGTGPSSLGSDNYTNALATYGSNDIGDIRYKVDGDCHWSDYVSEWDLFSAPFAFEDLNYGFYGAAGTPVVGSVGDNGVTINEANKTTYLHYGYADAAGDEIHTLTVADDDRLDVPYPSPEFSASDGIIFYFMVNPTTPTIRLTVSGNAQFVTSDLKAYFAPKIAEQKTYIYPRTGVVTITLRDINGGNISYRINGGSTVDVGASSVALTHADFANTGSTANTLETWFTATPGTVRTRTIYKNPAYPSAGETHGDVWWGGADNWAELYGRIIDSASPTYISSLRWWYDQYRTNNTYNAHSTILTNARSGKRLADSSSGAINAIVARALGMTAKKTGEATSYADYAKAVLLEHPMLIDPVGTELNTSNTPIACREHTYRGYRDCKIAFSSLLNYDVLIGYYRENQGYANGITPIEDIWLRDLHAQWAYMSLRSMAAGGDPVWTSSGEQGGMWDSARKVGALVACVTMPTYDSELYGTSGYDGVTTATHSWTPFLTDRRTWKEMTIDGGLTYAGWPETSQQGCGMQEYNIYDNGNWVEKIGYTTTTNMGVPMVVYGNFLGLYSPTTSVARLVACLNRAAAGTLQGTDGTAQRSWCGLQNRFYPEFRSVAQPWMLSLASTNSQSLGKDLNAGHPWNLLFYNHELPSGSAPVGTVATPEVDIDSGTYPTGQTVTVTIEAGATGRYNLATNMDAADPTSASGTVIANGGTIAIPSTAGTYDLRIIAYNGVDNDSAIKRSTYTITEPAGVVENPVISPSGLMWSANSVTITCGTSGASIYYTTDGSDPDSGDTLYSGPFLPPDGRTVIKAIGIKAGLTDSGISSVTLDVDYITAAENAWTVLAMPNRTSAFTLSFSVLTSAAAGNVYIAIADQPSEAPAHTEMTQVLRTNSTTGNFDARNGAVYAAVNTLAWANNTTYAVVLTVDVEANTYSLTVDGTVIATDYAFREAVTNIDSVVVWSGNTNAFAAYDFVLGVPGGGSTPLPKHRPEASRVLLVVRIS